MNRTFVLRDSVIIQGTGGVGAASDASYIVRTPNADLTNEQALSSLATGMVKHVGGGTLGIGTAGVDYIALDDVKRGFLF